MLSHYGIYQFLHIIIANIIAILSINKVKKVFIRLHLKACIRLLF